MNTEIKGNMQTRKELDQIANNDSVLHSYIFIGQDGIVKKEIAKEFAQKILCQSKEKNCTCKSCICFIAENHPDFQIINEEGTVIKIEQMRQMIQNVYEKPILSEKKVYIINDSDKMTKEAQNSLLKTLEEPPDYASFILIATNQDLILNTIKSRCTKIVFNNLTTNEIKEILSQRGFKISLSDKMINFFNGSIGKAIKILENKDIYIQVDKFIDSLMKQDKIDFFTNKEIFIKEYINEILEYCIVSLFYEGKEKKDVRILNCIKYVQETINRIKSYCNFDMSIDYMLLKIWEEVNENNRRS